MKEIEDVDMTDRLSEILRKISETREIRDIVASCRTSIDEEIKQYIDEINKFDVVKTLESCAGHENRFWDTPYLVLEFSSERVAGIFREMFVTLVNITASKDDSIFERVLIFYRDDDPRVRLCVLPRSDISTARKFLFETAIEIIKLISKIRGCKSGELESKRVD